jgi:hypothetical protein
MKAIGTVIQSAMIDADGTSLGAYESMLLHFSRFDNSPTWLDGVHFLKRASILPDSNLEWEWDWKLSKNLDQPMAIVKIHASNS